MDIRWKVSYIFRTPMQFQAGATRYPVLGASLVFDERERVSELDHEFLASDALSAGEIVELSKSGLTVLWEVMIYVSGYDVYQADHKVERLAAIPGNNTQTNLRTITANSLIVRPLQLPQEQQLLSANNRLHVWLRLANSARPPATAVDAIRNYYLIWEDMHGRNTAPGSPQEELKFTRHFVSHGDPVRDSRLTAFLDREIRVGTRQYDPNDPLHQRFVENHREPARLLVEAEINRHL